MHRASRHVRWLALGAVAGALVAPSPSAGFSVLAHQAVVDRAWDDTLVPALRARFPDADAQALDHARAFAYGGSHMPDLGYFPFGNRLFTDLLHYVRTGDFVAALLEEAETVDEYAFALGAASHWVTDTVGHPAATNPTVAELYPKLRRRYGPEVTYADDPGAHMQTEFRFDVRQVARDPGQLDLFRHAVAFEVSEPVLRRAFLRTYGLALDEVFTDADVAIRTYRWAFRELVHEATGVAWELYRADIKGLDPSMTPAAFVIDLSRGDFEREFGDAYRRAGYFARFIAFVVKLVPDVGPFRHAAYKPLPPDARERFDRAFDRIVADYRTLVARVPRIPVTNANLDTGRPSRRGDYRPADDTYAALLEKLDDRHFADVPRGLRADVLRFFGTGLAATDGDDARRLRCELSELTVARPRADAP